MLFIAFPQPQGNVSNADIEGSRATPGLPSAPSPTVRARAHWPLCVATGGRVFVAGIFIPVGNHYFQALASTLQFVAQVCDRLWLVPATDRAFAYITYMSPPHLVLVCSGPPQKRGHLWLNKVASVLGPLTKSLSNSRVPANKRVTGWSCWHA